MQFSLQTLSLVVSFLGAGAYASLDGTAANAQVINQLLNSTNYYRYIHGASPVTWNQKAADFAASGANKCVFEHSKDGPYGENLAAGSGSKDVTDLASLNNDVEGEIKMWYDESKGFNYGAGDTYNHFTALVWKGVTSIGCARVFCDPLTNSTGQVVFTGWYLQCEYVPTANVVGQCTENVLPATNNANGYQYQPYGGAAPAPAASSSPAKKGADGPTQPAAAPTTTTKAAETPKYTPPAPPAPKPTTVETSEKPAPTSEAGAHEHTHTHHHGYPQPSGEPEECEE